MHRQAPILLIFLVASLVSGCGQADNDVNVADKEPDVAIAAPAVTFTPASDAVGKPSGPVTVEYRIIGQPVVGQPVAIELRFASPMVEQPVKVSYRINDATALRLADSQPASLSVAPLAEDGGGVQRVTIVPLREGRLYLNVSANINSRDGSLGTVTAIPIQVGNAPRPVQQNGTAGTDEDGAAIRSLPASES